MYVLISNVSSLTSASELAEYINRRSIAPDVVAIISSDILIDPNRRQALCRFLSYDAAEHFLGLPDAVLEHRQRILTSRNLRVRDFIAHRR